MKKTITKSLLLLFVALAFSISATAQTLVNTTNATGPNLCNGSATLIDTTATAITWSSAGVIIQNTTYSIQNLCPGNYAVSYMGVFGNITLTFVIGTGTSNPCANFAASITTTASSAVMSGTASVVVTGGVAPYTYLWSNGATSANLTNLAAGSYSCVVTSSNGCVYTATGVVQGANTNPCANFLVSVSTQNSTSIAPCNGVATAVTSGGTAPYTYLWNTGASTPSVSSSCPGMYACVVTDASNCVYYDSAYIAYDTLVSITNTTFPGNVVIGNLGNVTVTNCTVNFAAINSASIGGAVNGTNGNVLITWIIVDSSGVSTTFTVPYLINNSNPGVFAATLTITCYQKAQAINTIVITDQVELPGYSLGLEEMNMELSFTNPFENSISLNWEGEKTGTIQLVNLQGNLVASGSFANANQVTLETVNVVKGTYFITMQLNGETIVRKMIK
jgi:hypothetical protein